MCHCEGPCVCTVKTCTTTTTYCTKTETCRTPCHHQCYYCECALEGTLYVYKLNPAYVSCKSCVPNNSDWCRQRDGAPSQPTCQTELPKHCCHCCKKVIKGIRYIYRENPKYSICTRCLPRYDRSDWCRSDSASYQSSAAPKCMRCGESPIRGHRYIYRRNKSYSLCKLCLPCYDSSDWYRETQSTSCISDCVKCMRCKKWPITGTVFTYRKNSAYHVCKNCLPHYDRNEWLPSIATEPSNRDAIMMRFVTHEAACYCCHESPIVGARYIHRNDKRYSLCGDCYMAKSAASRKCYCVRRLPWMRKIPGAVLCRGDYGDEVRHLQYLLTCLGFLALRHTDKLVGSFQGRTAEAVEKFRRKYCIGGGDMGVYDRRTAKALEDVVSKM